MVVTVKCIKEMKKEVKKQHTELSSSISKLEKKIDKMEPASKPPPIQTSSRAPMTSKASSSSSFTTHLAHNSNFNKVEYVTNSTVKTSKAYSSVWNAKARCKYMNVTDVTKNELRTAPFDHLVLAAPTVDITNIDTTKVSIFMEGLQQMHTQIV